MATNNHYCGINVAVWPAMNSLRHLCSMLLLCELNTAAVCSWSALQKSRQASKLCLSCCDEFFWLMSGFLVNGPTLAASLHHFDENKPCWSIALALWNVLELHSVLTISSWLFIIKLRCANMDAGLGGENTNVICVGLFSSLVSMFACLSTSLWWILTN